MPQTQTGNSEETEDEIYDMATQMMTDAAPAVSKRISFLAMQSNEPANTPPWSMAARLSNDAIEQFEKQKKAELKEAAKQKLKKRRYLFNTTSDEEDDDNDDDDSDLEFDLGTPGARISSLSAIKENASDESVEDMTFSNHSKHNARRQNDSDKRPSSKKHKANEENVKVVKSPAKRATRQLSVNVPRTEVDRIILSRGKKAMPKKNTKTAEMKIEKSNRPKSLESIGQKNSIAAEDAPDVRKSKRTKKSVTIESPPPVRQRRLQKDDKSKLDTSNKVKSKRNVKRGKADGDDDDENANAEQPPPMIIVSKIFFNRNILAKYLKAQIINPRIFQSIFSISFSCLILSIEIKFGVCLLFSGS